MRLMSFNVNSIRTRLHQLEAVIANHAPEIIGLQETKVTDEDFPVEAIREMGYHAVFHGQKTHYGVALLSRSEPINVERGFREDHDASQRRFIAGQYPLADGRILTVINCYFPQGESRNHPVKFPGKEKFYADLLAHLEAHHADGGPLIVMGDMNVAPLDADIGIGEDNRKRWLRDGKASFLPEEREWLQRLVDWGTFDSFRHCHKEEDNLFSWFDYRSRGFEREPRRGLRIDLILASHDLAGQVRDAGIDYDIRAMERPSDHCPVWVELDIPAPAET